MKKDKVIHIDTEVHKALSEEAHRRGLSFPSPNQVIRAILGMPVGNRRAKNSRNHASKE